MIWILQVDTFNTIIQCKTEIQSFEHPKYFNWKLQVFQMINVFNNKKIHFCLNEFFLNVYIDYAI